MFTSTFAALSLEQTNVSWRSEIFVLGVGFGGSDGGNVGIGGNDDGSVDCYDDYGQSGGVDAAVAAIRTEITLKLYENSQEGLNAILPIFKCFVIVVDNNIPSPR